MYKAKIKFNGKEYKGTLTFATMKDLQEMLEEIDRKMTITQIFEAITSGDIVVISIFILATLKTENEDLEEEISKNFELEGQKSLDELEEKFKKMMVYTNNIFKKCMPKNKAKKQGNERQFVSLDEEKDEWEYDNLEFLWNSILKRNSNFLDITPKNFFEQVDAYKKANKIDDEEVVIG